MEERTGFIENCNLLVIGLGKTGISVIKKMHDVCSSITAVDSNPELELETAFGGNCYKSYDNLKAIIGKEHLDEKEISKEINLMIVSPGVPGDMPLVRYAGERGIPVWSELELAWRLLDAGEQKRTVAVTGTNGKTTVVKLIGEILNSSGKNCVVCGNVGLPLIDTVNITGEDKIAASNTVNKKLIRVIEVSSFQMERVYRFKPYIGVILNVTSDHMDRHRTLDNYGRLKLKLFENQDSSGRAVFNADDSYIARGVAAMLKKQKQLPVFLRYGIKKEEGMDIFYKEGQIFYNIDKEKGKINVKDSPLRGKHNIYNIMASAASSLLLGVDKKNIERTVNNFKPLGHRLEYLGSVKKVRCFNDSKSTNPDATAAALGDFEKDVTLIMGGKDKDMDFSELINILNKKVKNLILIGESSEKIYKLIAEHDFNYKVFRCRTLEEAVNRGFEAAKPGEVLLLSPACASMDMFKDYRERGNKFRSLVFSAGKARAEKKN
jgi:UDP-N-acetylmuramoylalanine--D-glutamate ligase